MVPKLLCSRRTNKKEAKVQQARVSAELEKGKEGPNGIFTLPTENKKEDPKNNITMLENELLEGERKT
jgi:hypothetical protein